MKPIDRDLDKCFKTCRELSLKKSIARTEPITEEKSWFSDSGRSMFYIDGYRYTREDVQ